MYRHKYHAIKTYVNGERFDSKAEANRYQELLLLQKAGEISDLQRQVEYELVPAQREPDKTGPRGGKIKGTIIERPVTYRADFVYKENGQTVVEDVKGVRTPEYIIKRKLLLYRYGIRIKETM